MLLTRIAGLVIVRVWGVSLTSLYAPYVHPAFIARREKAAQAVQPCAVAGSMTAATGVILLAGMPALAAWVRIKASSGAL